ncbi:MAG: hypothetical protein KUG64_10720 [Cycloclasticus sp.]|nr:hypothetical protein [Cycloclasticus sp.]
MKTLNYGKSWANTGDQKLVFGAIMLAIYGTGSNTFKISEVIEVCPAELFQNRDNAAIKQYIRRCADSSNSVAPSRREFNKSEHMYSNIRTALLEYGFVFQVKDWTFRSEGFERFKAAVENDKKHNSGHVVADSDDIISMNHEKPDGPENEVIVDSITRVWNWFKKLFVSL